MKGLIEELWTTATAHGGLDHGQRQCRDSKTVSFYDVGSGEVASSKLNPGTPDVVAHTRHGDFDELRCESRHPVPPSGGKPGGHSSVTVTPDGRPNPRGVSERSIVDEEDPSGAPPPMTGPDQSIDRKSAQSALFGLTESDHAIVAAQVVIEHV